MNSFVKIRISTNKHLNPGLITQDYNNYITDAEEELRSLLIIPINEKIGLFNWAVLFVEESENKYIVNIFSDTLADYENIYSIIIVKMPSFRFLFKYQGNAVDYIQRNSFNEC